MQHPDASKIVRFSDDQYQIPHELNPTVFGGRAATLMYCMAECYDMAYEWTTAGYDGATTYGPVQNDVDYDVGQSSGQFMLVGFAE